MPETAFNAAGGHGEGNKPFGSNPGETATLERLMALRNEHPEWSFNKLGAQMDAEGKAPRNGGKWHPFTAKRIVTANEKTAVKTATKGTRK